MFTNLRESAKGFFAKVILFFLVAMFALWGVGDVFRSMGGGPVNVATVAKTPITLEEFRHSVRRDNSSPEKVLGGLINDLLIEKETESLGLVVDDDQIADFIGNLGEFKGKDGQFDKDLYQNMLMNAGTNERRFVEDIRHEIAAKLLISAFTSETQVPKSIVETLYRLQEEQRAADIILLPGTAFAAHVTSPDAAEIKDYYDAHPKSFMAPEYRTLSYLVLPLADIQAKIDVPPEEIKRAYDERKDDFRQPEQRQVEDMQFDNEEDAKEAAGRIAKGEPFAHVAASAPISNKGKTSLGLITRQQVPHGAEKIFAVGQDGTTPPSMVDFSWNIYHVSKIVPEHASSFEEARKAIADEIAAREAQDTAAKLINGLEDAIAGGATLEQAAEKINAKALTLPPLTKDGTLQDGTKAALPPYDNFLSVAFATPEKDHSQAVQTSDGSYFVIRVDKVAAEHVKPLADVRGEVTKAVLAERTEALLQKTAQAVYDAIAKGKRPQEALAAAGTSLKPVPAGNLRPDSRSVPQGALKGQALPHAMTAELFHLNLQGTTHPYPTGDGNYVMAIVKQITPAPEAADPKVLEQIHTSLKETLTNENIHNYLNYLRGKYPVTINAQALGMNDKKEEAGGE